MKWTSFSIAIALLCVVLLAGCSTTRITNNTDGEYVIRAILLQLPAPASAIIPKLENFQNLKQLRMSSEEIETHLSLPESDVTEFPLVYLDPANKKTISTLSPLTYATEWDSYGHPSGFEVVGVGQYISATLNSVTSGVANISIDLQFRSDPDWFEYESGVSQPFFRKSAIKTVVSTPLNQWATLKGMISSTSQGGTTKTLKTLYVIKVEKVATEEPAP